MVKLTGTFNILIIYSDDDYANILIISNLFRVRIIT